MPTGVAVSPAMHHGGPYPATNHPGFTSVGIPTSFLRFAARHCYDNVSDEYLPEELRAKNPTGRMWRLVDGTGPLKIFKKSCLLPAAKKELNSIRSGLLAGQIYI
ncbi:MAG: hypothetical protein WC524_02930 [Candidatus Aminicenantales bacterium]